MSSENGSPDVGERCSDCDRAGCRVAELRAIKRGDDPELRGPMAEQLASIELSAAMVNCYDHRIDWRTRCLALDRDLAVMTETLERVRSCHGHEDLRTQLAAATKAREEAEARADAAWTGLQNLASIMGVECDKEVALGVATSCVSKLMAANQGFAIDFDALTAQIAVLTKEREGK